jgi:hypothetical protein
MQVNTLLTKLVNMISQSYTVRKILCGVHCSLDGDDRRPSLAFVLKHGNMVKQMFNQMLHARAPVCNVRSITITLYCVFFLRVHFGFL